MQRSRETRRTVAGAVALTALIGGVALAGPTPAALAAAPGPVFSELGFDQDVNTWTTSSCTVGTETETDSPATTLADNGSATLSASRSQRFTGVAVVPDTMDANVAQKATAISKTRNGLPAELRLDFNGGAKATPSQADSFCDGNADADATLRFAFTTTKSLWATLSYTKSGNTTSEIYLHSTNRGAQPYEDLFGQLFKGSGGTTVLLPPGEYAGVLDGGISLTKTTVSKSVTGSASLKISFAEVGSATSLPSGAASGYVSLAASRTCSAHNLAARLTTNPKLINAVGRVSFIVNGRTLKTLTGTQVKRGVTVKLPIADGTTTSARAGVKLKSGKTLTTSAGYRPCA